MTTTKKMKNCSAKRAPTRAGATPQGKCSWADVGASSAKRDDGAQIRLFPGIPLLTFPSPPSLCLPLTVSLHCLPTSFDQRCRSRGSNSRGKMSLREGRVLVGGSVGLLLLGCLVDLLQVILRYALSMNLPAVREMYKVVTRLRS